jgi:hypothetical protein
MFLLHSFFKTTPLYLPVYQMFRDHFHFLGAKVRIVHNAMPFVNDVLDNFDAFAEKMLYYGIYWLGILLWTISILPSSCILCMT